MCTNGVGTKEKRLLEHVTSLNILHKSQIGFLPKNRTSDHLLTLRTLIDKYVHCHREKVYACFIDFRKAFDSVWHDGLFAAERPKGASSNIIRI